MAFGNYSPSFGFSIPRFERIKPPNTAVNHHGVYFSSAVFDTLLDGVLVRIVEFFHLIRCQWFILRREHLCLSAAGRIRCSGHLAGKLVSLACHQVEHGDGSAAVCAHEFVRLGWIGG